MVTVFEDKSIVVAGESERTMRVVANEDSGRHLDRIAPGSLVARVRTFNVRVVKKQQYHPGLER